MARLIKRFFGKKRGEHNMRSDTVGGAWWAIFSALFLLAGCYMLANLLSQVMIPEWRANNDFRPTQGRVLDKRLQQRETEEGDHVYRPELLVAYDVDAQHYEQWTYDAARMFNSNREASQAVLDRFQVGQEYPCWFDPVDPAEIVLVRGYSWHAWLFLILPVPFIAIGGGGLAYAWLNWGKSAERRAALAQQASKLPIEFETSAMQVRFPYIPSCDDLTNSAGTTLAYRLPNEPTGWSVLGLSLLTLTWIGVTSIFVVMSVRGFQRAAPEWFLTFFAAICSAVGIALILITARRFMVTTGIDPTVLEIDRHPLHPGESYPLFLSQTGRLMINRLRLLLVCEEESHYQQGTNLRIETRRVYQAAVFDQEGVEIQPGKPFEVRLTLEIPPEAMHSFEGEHNKINWRLIVESDVSRWPNFRRAYTLVVHPSLDAEP